MWELDKKQTSNYLHAIQVTASAVIKKQEDLIAKDQGDFGLVARESFSEEVTWELKCEFLRADCSRQKESKCLGPEAGRRWQSEQ